MGGTDWREFSWLGNESPATRKKCDCSCFFSSSQKTLQIVAQNAQTLHLFQWLKFEQVKDKPEEISWAISSPVPYAQLCSQWPIFKYSFSEFGPVLIELFQPGNQVFTHSCSSTPHDLSSPITTVFEEHLFVLMLLAFTGILTVNE